MHVVFMQLHVQTCLPTFPLQRTDLSCLFLNVPSFISRQGY
jgi:hypothetical protein